MLRSIALAAFLLLTACPGTATATNPGASAPPVAQASDRTGTVHRITGDVWGVTPDDQPTQRYCFEGQLANPLRVDGKKIRFSGTQGEIKPTERRACTPFTLASASAA